MLTFREQWDKNNQQICDHILHGQGMMVVVNELQVYACQKHHAYGMIGNIFGLRQAIVFPDGWKQISLCNVNIHIDNEMIGKIVLFVPDNEWFNGLEVIYNGDPITLNYQVSQ